MEKTNALRQLDRAKIAYTVRSYAANDGLIDGRSVAQKVGLPAEDVYKTLVTQAPSLECFVFVIPVNCELDLKKAARACGQKSVHMLPQAQLLPTTGYVHGGCSPVGMKKRFKTFLSECASGKPQIAVSAGKIGLQMLLSADALVQLTAAHYAPLTVD